MAEETMKKVIHTLIWLALLAYLVLVFSDASRWLENLALYTTWTIIFFEKACERHGFHKWPGNLLRALLQMGIVLLLVNLVIQVFSEASQRRLVLLLILLAYIVYLLVKQMKK